MAHFGGMPDPQDKQDVRATKKGLAGIQQLLDSPSPAGQYAHDIAFLVNTGLVDKQTATGIERLDSSGVTRLINQAVKDKPEDLRDWLIEQFAKKP